MHKKLNSASAANPAKIRAFNSLTLALSILMLSSCYVEVGPYASAYYDTEVNYNTDITDFDTDYLVLAALTPLALGMESTDMLTDPDAYTTPRSNSRATVIETTYAYLYDDWYCDGGGYTEIESEADTTSYDDGYTYVDLQLSSEAHHCTGWSQGTAYTVNSDLFYDVYGWYDDWEREISAINTHLTGEIIVSYGNKAIDHSHLDLDLSEISATDFGITVDSDLGLDIGYDFETASMTTDSLVHWYRYDDHPHQGQIRIQDGYDWITLTFDAYGVQREDSTWNYSYWSWSELGY